MSEKAIKALDEATNRWREAKEREREARSAETAARNHMISMRKELEQAINAYGANVPREAEWGRDG